MAAPRFLVFLVPHFPGRLMGSHGGSEPRIAARRGVEKLNAVQKSVRQARKGAANSGGVSLFADLSLRLRI